jgi:hypothetical protein
MLIVMNGFGKGEKRGIFLVGLLCTYSIRSVKERARLKARNIRDC